MANDSTLDELVRQAEVHVTAELTTLVGTFQRGVTLTGILFAASAASASAVASISEEVPLWNVVFGLMVGSTFACALSGSSIVMAKFALPGAIDLRPSTVERDCLLEALLERYRLASRQNRFRLALSRGLMSLALLVAATGIARGLYDAVQIARAPQRAAEVVDKGGGNSFQSSSANSGAPTGRVDTSDDAVAVAEGPTTRSRKGGSAPYTLRDCRDIRTVQGVVIVCRTPHGGVVYLEESSGAVSTTNLHSIN